MGNLQLYKSQTDWGSNWELMTALLAQHTATQTTVVFAAQQVEAARTGRAEFDQVLVDPVHHPSLVLSPPHRVGGHVLEQRVQSDN